MNFAGATHSFQFLDPPCGKTESYGANFGFEQYEQMAEFMGGCKGKMVVSIHDHIDGIYRWFYICSLLAGMQQNKPIDWNAQADYEQMTYLHYVDRLVSSDTKFLRDAFEALWFPTGKKLMAPEVFVQFIKRL